MKRIKGKLAKLERELGLDPASEARRTKKAAAAVADGRRMILAFLGAASRDEAMCSRVAEKLRAMDRPLMEALWDFAHGEDPPGLKQFWAELDAWRATKPTAQNTPFLDLVSRKYQRCQYQAA